MRPLQGLSESELLERLLRLGSDLQSQEEAHQRAVQRALSCAHLSADDLAEATAEKWREWGRLRSLVCEGQNLLDELRTRLKEESR